MHLVYFSPVPFSSFAQRPHKFVEWFHNQYGGKVLWIDPYPTRLPRLSDINYKNDYLANDIQNPDWIQIIKPFALPLEPIFFLRYINEFLWSKLKKTIKVFSSVDECMIGVGKPSILALSVVKDLGELPSFYDAMDDFPNFYDGLSKNSMKKIEEELISTVSKIYASSTYLYDRIKIKRNDVVIMKNAYCNNMLPLEKAVLKKKSEKVIGYIGTVGKWFDWDFIDELAKKNPDWIVRIIGPIYEKPNFILNKNVEILPACSHKDALEKISEFTIGIIPFKKNLLTHSVDPIKYYEYRALGIPVLSTDFGEMGLREFENGVFIVKKIEDIPNAIIKCREHFDDFESIKKFREDNYWNKVFYKSFIIKKTKSIALILVNYRSEEHIKKNITFINQQTIKPDRLVIVNNSVDKEASELSWMESIDFLDEKKNVGFAAANNDAISRSAEDYILLLNPDAFPDPKWIEALIKAASDNPHIAAFGSCQLQAEKSGYLDGVGDVYHMSGLAWREGYNKKINSSYRQKKKIFSPCAGAALYRREVFEAVGGFDEDLFCYLEDVDLGFRLQLAGYKSMYVPDAIVHHVGGASSGGGQSDFSIYHGHRNIVWVYVKNMPGILFWLLLPLHVAMNVFALIWFTTKGKGKVIWQAKLDAIIGLPKIWNKRKLVQLGRKVSIGYIWKILNKGIVRH